MGDCGVPGDVNSNVLVARSTGDAQLDKAVWQWLSWDKVGERRPFPPGAPPAPPPVLPSPSLPLGTQPWLRQLLWVFPRNHSAVRGGCGCARPALTWAGVGDGWCYPGTWNTARRSPGQG